MRLLAVAVLFAGALASCREADPMPQPDTAPVTIAQEGRHAVATFALG